MQVFRFIWVQLENPLSILLRAAGFWDNFAIAGFSYLQETPRYSIRFPYPGIIHRPTVGWQHVWTTLSAQNL